MADTIEKVYCTGDGGNDNLAAALLARGRDNDPATMLAAMNGGMGGGWNNPFAYMMMLGMFRFMYGDGWNGQNGNVQRSEIQSQIDSLRTQMSDNHNSDLLMGDVTIEVEGKQTIYTIPEHLGVTFAGETVLATDKADLLPEVGKLVNEADEIIKAYEPSKERKAKGEELLAALNPAIKEKQETEKRFKALEGDISGIRGMVKQLLDKLG